MKVVRLFSLVKFSHTIFALPFALASMLLAAGGLPPARTFLLIVVCMVAARTAAMAFNRYLDAGLDARNPRTATREIPRGLISKKLALGIALGSALLFIVAAGAINRLSLILSPVALGILFFYSFTKRFSDFSHLFLGLCLGMFSQRFLQIRNLLLFQPLDFCRSPRVISYFGLRELPKLLLG